MRNTLTTTLVTAAIALTLTGLTGTASAANFVSVDMDRVTDTKTKVQSTAQYIRAGYDTSGVTLGLQARTAVFENNGMLNSLEGTVGKDFSLPLSKITVTPFVGAGHDNGFNGGRGKDYQYGLVGVNVGAPIGPVYAFSGIKTRVNFDKTNPEQTVAFGGVSYPLTKAVSVSASVSASRQDIKENAFGVGVRVAF
jgi:hypothetical protein